MTPEPLLFAVDWDNTLVQEYKEDGTRYWPDSGDWLPGAVDALRQLSSYGRVAIFSLRTHLYEVGDLEPRSYSDVEYQYDLMRKMLDAAGLRDVEVYDTGRGKPPARYIIDDKGVRFAGSWRPILQFIESAEAVRKASS